jgi:hypothetical protein
MIRCRCRFYPSFNGAIYAFVRNFLIYPGIPSNGISALGAYRGMLDRKCARDLIKKLRDIF